MADKKMLEVATDVLMIVGGVNWGLALVKINLVEMLATKLGQPVVATVAYALVAASALYYGYNKYMKK